MFIALFFGGLLDQAMLQPISAALEKTGRIRNAPWGRAVRIAASDQLVFLADEADRRAEMERLIRLHRDVKGVGDNQVRYSALNPEFWNWILISTFFVQRNAFISITGEQLSAADDQVLWDYYRRTADGLQLPSRSRLPESYPEIRAHYDRMVREKLEPTRALDNSIDTLRRLPQPDFLPRVAAPLWKIVGPVTGHVATVLGFGIMHPDVRALAAIKWTRRHDWEFTLLTKLVQLAYRRLPKRLTYTPLAYNRWKYQQLTTQYRRVGLTSFTQPPGQTPPATLSRPSAPHGR